MAEMHGMAAAGAPLANGSMGHHGAAMLALLFLPVLIFVFVLAMQAGALAGIGLARRFEQGYRNAGPSTHLAVLATAMTATIHLALAPGHFAEDQVLGSLFTLDGIALGLLAVSAYLVDFWRAPALLLVTAGLLAYAFYILTGREAVDAVGIFTKLLEIAAVVLILFGNRSNQRLGRATPSVITEASS